MQIIYKKNVELNKDQVSELFLAVHWDSGKYKEKLKRAIKNSETVITAWEEEKLIGLISAISDGAINMFITYLLVDPQYQCRKIGTTLMTQMAKEYESFNRNILTTELDKENFYNRFGFENEGIAMIKKQWDNVE